MFKEHLKRKNRTTLSSKVRQIRQSAEHAKVAITTAKDNPDNFLAEYQDAIKNAFPGSIEEAIKRQATLVLIPAHNEIHRIGATLLALSQQKDILVQPLVVDNASTDSTGEFAEKLGAVVVYEENQGVLDARRRGFKEIKEKGYQGIILSTDSDSTPLPSWARTMVDFAKEALPTGGEAFGRVLYYDGADNPPVGKNTMLTVAANARDTIYLAAHRTIVRGPNTVIVLDSEGKILDSLAALEDQTDLPHGQDVYQKDTIAQYGEIAFNKHLPALVITSGKRYPRRIDVLLRYVAPKRTLKRLYSA